MQTQSAGRVAADFVRSFPLDDIQIRAGGDGRTVEAYAAVFDTPTEIHDQQGHYREQLARTSFNKTISEQGMRVGVYYNHGLTLHGTPSDLGSVPLGSPVEAPRVDGRGVVTVSRYNRSALADSVLESIRNGDITGQSFRGRFVVSTPSVPRGGYRAAGDGSLPLVTRQEIAMREYGPTPMPAYDVPMILGVRHRTDDAGRARALSVLHGHYSRATLTGDDTANLTLLLAQLAAADGAIDPIVQALCAGNVALDNAMMVISAMLTVPDPDLDDASEDPEDIPTDATQTPVVAYASGRRPGTGISPAATVEPLHALRTVPVAQRVRAGLIARGVA